MKKILIRLVTPELAKAIDDLIEGRKHLRTYPGGKKKEKVVKEKKVKEGVTGAKVWMM